MSYGLDTILDEDLSSAGVSREFYWGGFDRGGRPCLVFRACEHKKSDADKGASVEQKVRLLCPDALFGGECVPFHDPPMVGVSLYVDGGMRG